MTPREKKRLKKKKENNLIKTNKPNKSLTYNNFLLTVIYDGSNFGGYAKQKFPNTIEERLNTVINKYLTDDVKLISASRTDAKVHALDQKICFKTLKKIDNTKFLNYMKENLPDGIKIKGIVQVKGSFHCRYDVANKTYIYKVNTSEDFFLRNYSYFWDVKNVNVQKINSICELFVGSHDFIGFSNPKRDSKDTVRTINYFKFIQETESFYYFEINGNGFLYNMIRIMISAIIYWYENKVTLAEIEGFILSKEKFTLASKLSPGGLYLKEINYELN